MQRRCRSPPTQVRLEQWGCWQADKDKLNEQQRSSSGRLVPTFEAASLPVAVVQKSISRLVTGLGYLVGCHEKLVLKFCCPCKIARIYVCSIKVVVVFFGYTLARLLTSFRQKIMQRPGETGWNNSCTAFMKSPFGLNATKIEPSENCDDDTGMFFPTI